MRQAPELVTLTVLAVTGGVLTSVVVEEMLTGAHEGDTSAWGPILLTGGFALFAAISVYLGSCPGPSWAVSTVGSRRLFPRDVREGASRSAGSLGGATVMSSPARTGQVQWA